MLVRRQAITPSKTLEIDCEAAYERANKNAFKKT
jgi:hypothetical protein